MVLMALTWLMLGLLIGAAAFFGAGLIAALLLGGDVRDTDRAVVRRHGDGRTTQRSVDHSRDRVADVDPRAVRS